MIEIIIFAIIAGLLIARLNSVLGQKNDGDEFRGRMTRDNASPTQDSNEAGGKVINLPGREPIADSAMQDEADSDLPVSVDAQIKRVQRIDQYFDEDHFNTGVKAAFPMVVEAFAAGDKDTLRNLLDDGIYQDFAAAIDDRKEAGESLSTEIKEIHDVSIIEAKTAGKQLEITVRIISDQVNELTRQQAVNEGNNAEPATVEVTDIWTFARPVNSPDPNWKLIETSVDT